MRTQELVTIDGNEAAAWTAYNASDVIAIYPITPSSTMGEFADAWAARHEPNLHGHVPTVVEMQSEGGAAGAIHGALQAGSSGTTFTASQGLLLMIPNMYKIAGELTPFVMHIAARSLAAQGLSIFGDHSDVMAVRQTGFALLASASVQEVMDLSLVAHAATLEARIPFAHFFDGFRTSHEVTKIEKLTRDDMRAVLDEARVHEHCERALTPDKPVMRGTAQNPDVYFQGRETANPYYARLPQIVQGAMDRLGAITGRKYRLFDYAGHPQAERIIIVMGSGAETAEETSLYLNREGEKTGVVRVHLFRPFSVSHFIESLPRSVKAVAVLDRCKEPGSAGEPLYQDVLTAFVEGLNNDPTLEMPRVIGGRYGLSSKEFTPGMAKAVFDELSKAAPKNHFTIGINDDVSHTSLDFDPEFSLDATGTYQAVFFGLGADGTVSANKNTIKIIGEETENYAQGYFVYDSKKSGSITVSHLRFGSKPIRSPFLVSKADFVACHQFNFVEKYDMLSCAKQGAVFLINSPHAGDAFWDTIPVELQETMIKKQLRVYAVDAYRVAKDAGLGRMINTIMQTCFFAVSNVIPQEEAIPHIKTMIKKSFGKRGEEILKRNYEAVDRALSGLSRVELPTAPKGNKRLAPVVSPNAPDFVKKVTAAMMSGNGDLLPVSAIPADGTWPTGTTKWEKRSVAQEVPVWDAAVCIQCGKCSFVCPHSVIRIKSYPVAALNGAPATFKHVKTSGESEFVRYTIQVSPDDCTGCSLCVEVCPAKNKSRTSQKAINMAVLEPIRQSESENWNFFSNLPSGDPRTVKSHSVKGSQFLDPYFEFSGACAGCGETPYIKLATQLFGDRMIIANATGCSSIYGGNLPTTPYSKDASGRGPAWSNSLFEDNAEFGLGMRLAVDQKNSEARALLEAMRYTIGGGLVDSLLGNAQTDEADIYEQRQNVERLKQGLKSSDPSALRLGILADYLVKKSVWIIGGDGWAYDIGYGGLDHVLASGRNVNILILDTEVYSNTGGQMSKSTPVGAVAKFAAGGKELPKKDIGLLAMSYGTVYVARVAMGANDTHTVKAFLEAEKFNGPSLIIAYSHCIAHGYDLRHGMQQQKLAVKSGHWNLFRYHPEATDRGENPLVLDSHGPEIPVKDYMYRENRFKMLSKMDPDRARLLLHSAQEQVYKNWSYYQNRMEFHAPQKMQGNEDNVPDTPERSLEE